MASTNQTPGEGLKHPLSDSEIDQKMSESPAGETGDDIRSEKYAKKDDPIKKEIDRGPDFDKYSDQEDGDTSANAGVFK
jgi:hypothetical protein